MEFDRIQVFTWPWPMQFRRDRCIAATALCAQYYMRSDPWSGEVFK